MHLKQPTEARGILHKRLQSLFGIASMVLIFLSIMVGDTTVCRTFDAIPCMLSIGTTLLLSPSRSSKQSTQDKASSEDPSLGVGTTLALHRQTLVVQPQRKRQGLDEATIQTCPNCPCPRHCRSKSSRRRRAASTQSKSPIAIMLGDYDWLVCTLLGHLGAADPVACPTGIRSAQAAMSVGFVGTVECESPSDISAFM